MSDQIKKNPNDPDWQDLNPKIIALAHQVGFIRQPYDMWFEGQVTWQEALETMVALLGKEYIQTKKLLNSALQETPQIALGLTYEDTNKLIKKLPSPPCLSNQQ